MGSDLIINGALVNCGRTVKTDEFLSFVSSRLPNVKFYKFQTKQGSIAGSAFDWQAMTNIASLITIGQVLWIAYNKFIKPILNKNPKSSADIYIHIRTKETNVEQFMLGKRFKDKKSFIIELKKVTKKVESTRLIKKNITKISKKI